ncbi:hypothetical protein [Paenibacillus larvae]|uniref:Uncharacterized protein n=2 Tax=root TaxID=1 RepID=A0A2I7SCF3_9CAUD|nr:hypothetical protein [Paenibacillus larvae]YP_009836288.1 hypothetical protein HWB43_gp31 [Paenibacillus phage BN12]AUS03582.1 hypothetical protein BN12_31 [Paenibacillus phage BN12]ETK29848.1 hypothetical protein ERIC1_1c34070 [Paenibacillus larvae subsp. larvae DSM 25719]MCY9687681.1 hypothetical protein [Paenibacillus larvae]MCY9712559.1 hypothetical protein [Paenibacillus larvae]MCY9717822.1 hypothetical protein [Paenibacillus larvae]
MTEFGAVVVVEGKEFKLTGDADFTNRVLGGWYTDFNDASEGEEYQFEMSAPGLDNEGNEVTVYWIFTDIKGEKGKESLDEYDYDNVDRVVYE